jgi:SAM-dependent methyltransferase
MPRNIAYQTETIGDFYRTHRRRWQDFYQSERHVLDMLAARGASLADVLDVGCAAGGLADALHERFGSIRTYTGVDINRRAAEIGAGLASKTGPAKTFIAADICESPQLAGRTFDLVTSFGVADWNVDTNGIVAKCWEHVRPNGHLVLSLRLTPEATLSDIASSFQYIWFEPTPPPADAERAPYKVINIAEAISWLAAQSPRPEHLYIYGAWGKPSAVARTSHERILFSVIAMRKPAGSVADREPEVETHLPASAFAAPGR